MNIPINSVSIRPTKRSEAVVKKLISEGRFNRMMNDILESMELDSPPILRIEIDELQEERAAHVSRIAVIDASIVSKQSKLNSYIHKEDAIIGAQKEILKMWMQTAKDGFRGESQFRNWLTGPANLELMSKAGFKNDDQAVVWCKAQKGSL